MCKPGLMNLTLDTTVALHGTVQIPLLGFGTFKVKNGQDVEQAVATALDLGYRHIDTAVIYRNEEGVGRAVAASGIDRSEIFVTTKVWNSDQGHEPTLQAIDASLERLGMDYVDLYLVHWPKPAHTPETWQAMEEIQASGKAQAIGVSNYLTHHLDQLLEKATVLPSINQIQFHPHLQSPDLVDYCDDRGIVIEAWGPLKRGQVIDDPELAAIAATHGLTVPQVVLRWMLQRGVVTIPKSVTPSRIAENADLYGFELSTDEMAAINAMDRDDRVGAHPDHIDF
jgi:diketogulonate reductase-like aldo/keto reductase